MTATAGHSGVDRLVGELAATGAGVRTAEPDDCVDGVRPGLVVTPTDTATTAAAMRVLAAHELAVVARGSGTKLDWGLPPQRFDVLLDLAAMDHVLEHASGDLVVRVQAGTRLDALRATLGEARQRLALDPLTNPGTDGSGTVGGVIATAADGPLRLAHGAVRDLVIGVTIVRADGVVAKAGGKVVKNVAGYDLGKLFAGSYGTLGIVTEAVFRLHPLPQTSRWIVRSAPDAVAAVELALRVTRSQLVPAAVEIDRPASGQPAVAVLIDGMGAGVQARADAVAALVDGEVRDEAPPWWGRAPWQAEGTAVRLTSELTGLGALVGALDALSVPVDLRGSAGVGKLHAAFAPHLDAARIAAAVDTLRGRAAAWGGDVVVLRAPHAVRSRVDSWGPVRGLPLMRRIKDQFDPGRLLAPGRFVGGI
jgi:glycolate oxidase FAD binding subunit